ncbi:PadR family transcriptional regulator [Azospirillum halopraeferens]|uniref:PadR family transcriptional regulator n=1 Tax=Azospirillum halopraeferens TaxID=34010 RepID=UPI00040F42A2|nr:PadR family transcriptional regulator [Azospirillum halopraeferens]
MNPFPDRLGEHGCGKRHMHGGGPHRHGRRGFGHGHEGGEGRGGRRRVFDSGELRLLLLKLIADQPRHGYDIIRAVEELSGGAYAPSPGVVYPTLSLLEEQGLITPADPEGGRKAFTVTAAGTAELATEQDAVAAVVSRLGGLAERRGRTDGAPVRRAMENLRNALTLRLGREDVDAATLHAAVDILDEAARRIERLA